MDPGRPVSVVYAESSAVLRWLLGAAGGAEIERQMAAAPAVVTSELTSAEVGRTLQRLVATGHLNAAAGERVWAAYSHASQHWHLYAIAESVLARAGQAFPREPVRTLDAIHLATAALHGREMGVPLVLSVDQQLRANAAALGFRVAP